MDKNNKSNTSRNSSKVLSSKRRSSKTSKNSSISARSNSRGVESIEEPKARLTKLEEWLVERVNHDETPFDLVFASSNPGLTGLQSFPAWECWWESYRTIDKIPYNNILRLDQEILFAGNIIISQSSEALARQEAYLLAEEVDRRIVGQSPLIENVTDVILPIFDADASFSQMEGSGLFTLTIYYIFIWRIAKGGSDA